MKPGILYEFETEKDRKIFAIKIDKLLQSGVIPTERCVGSSFPDAKRRGDIVKMKSSVEFSGVPMGTEGEVERDGKLWKVTWNIKTHSDGRPRFKPLVDWFSDDEKENFLELIK